MEREAIYVTDPMCTWCWGFAPESSELARAIQGRGTMRVVAGGLSVGTCTPLLPGEAEGMVAEWRRVHEATGQPFDFDHPADEHTVFDTGPACRALALVGREQADKALTMLHALQNAFFVERRDMRDPATLRACAEHCGVPGELADRADSDAAREALAEDMRFAQRLGVRGFPAVALRSDARIQLLTLGYRPWKDLAPHVQNWLQQG